MPWYDDIAGAGGTITLVDSSGNISNTDLGNGVLTANGIGDSATHYGDGYLKLDLPAAIGTGDFCIEAIYRRYDGSGAVGQLVLFDFRPYVASYGPLIYGYSGGNVLGCYNDNQGHIAYYPFQDSEFTHVIWGRKSGASFLFIGGRNGNMARYFTSLDSVNYSTSVDVLGSSVAPGSYYRHEIASLRCIVGSCPYDPSAAITPRYTLFDNVTNTKILCHFGSTYSPIDYTGPETLALDFSSILDHSYQRVIPSVGGPGGIPVDYETQYLPSGITGAQGFACLYSGGNGELPMYVTFPHSTGLGFSGSTAWTLEMSVALPSGGSGYGHLFSQRSSGVCTFDLTVDNATGEVFWYGDTLGFNSLGFSLNIDPSTFDEITVVYTGTSFRIYLNGGLQTSPNSTIGNSTIPFTIGGLNFTSEYFWGYIDKCILTPTAKYTGNYTLPGALNYVAQPHTGGGGGGGCCGKGITLVWKNGQASNKAPSASDLVPGELALNLVSGAFYTKKWDGTVIQLNKGTGGGVLTADILNATAVGRNLLLAADAAAIRALLSLYTTAQLDTQIREAQGIAALQ